MTNLVEAFGVACNYHAGQRYGESDYIHHLTEVYDSVLNAGYDENHLMVAYLHDIIEDTKCDKAQLELLGFPQEVVDAVVAMTKVKGEEYADYIVKVCSNEMAYVVKIHDTLCNLTNSVGDNNWKRVSKYSIQLNLLVMVKAMSN